MNENSEMSKAHAIALDVLYTVVCIACVAVSVWAGIDGQWTVSAAAGCFAVAIVCKTIATAAAEVSTERERDSGK